MIITEIDKMAFIRVSLVAAVVSEHAILSKNLLIALR